MNPEKKPPDEFLHDIEEVIREVRLLDNEAGIADESLEWYLGEVRRIALQVLREEARKSKRDKN